MAAFVYLKSLIWLAGFSALGFVLLNITSPSQEKINEIKSKSQSNLTDDEKRKVLFLQKLKNSTSEAPIYLQKPKDSK